MTDSCMFCGTEPIDPEGWFVKANGLEVICPWCINDLENLLVLSKKNGHGDIN